MGLYLCIFEGEDEEAEDIDGVDVGPYAAFGAFRDYLASELENGRPGSRFPVLMLHSDCDGEWSPSECQKLVVELGAISNELQARPPIGFASDWQARIAKELGLVPRNAAEAFIDVNGELLIDRIKALAEKALTLGLPIVFQ